jgi:hypothetical protein
MGDAERHGTTRVVATLAAGLLGGPYVDLFARHQRPLLAPWPDPSIAEQSGHQQEGRRAVVRNAEGRWR